MAHTNAWSETVPADAEALSDGASRIRTFRKDVRERLALEHHFSSSGNQAYDGMIKLAFDAAKTGAYTLLNLDSIVLADTSGGAFTFTLPETNAAGIGSGKIFYIILETAGNDLTIDAGGTNILDGADQDLVLNTATQVLAIVSNGGADAAGNWHVLQYTDLAVLLTGNQTVAGNKTLTGDTVLGKTTINAKNLLQAKGGDLTLAAGTALTLGADGNYFDVTNDKIIDGQTTIAFDDNNPAADGITDSGNGLGGFAAAEKVYVYGSGINDGVYLIGSVAANQLTLDAAAALSNESAGATIDLLQVIETIGTLGIGTVIRLHFDGVVALVHSADLTLPGAADYLTSAGDEITLVEYATGDWRVTSIIGTTSMFPQYAVGSIVEFYDGTPVTYTGDTIYALAHGYWYFDRPGTVRFTWNQKVSGVVSTSTVQWYKNGIAYGSPVTANTASYVAKSIDIVVSAGDVVYCHQKISGASFTTYVDEMKLLLNTYQTFIKKHTSGSL